MGAKRKGRIRQTRTVWQRTFDPYPGMVQPFSWSERIPEFVHISIALYNNDYETVKKDFYEICDYVNQKVHLQRKFHFNLTHAIKLIPKETTILEKILDSSFREAFQQILIFYQDIFEISVDKDIEFKPKLLFNGYKQILDGRSDTSILCKYLMVQYEQSGRPDFFGLFKWNSKEEIVDPNNVSTIMALFPPSIGLSENLDLGMCQDLWMYNYLFSPRLPKPDDSKMEEEHYLEMGVDKFKNEFIDLYGEFKKLNLLAIYPRFIAEINMGFVSRISNLSIEAVEFVKLHKGEIAELLFRTILESFIVGSWLLIKKDVKLHERFREFSTGREKYFGSQLEKMSSSETFKKAANKIIDKAVKEAGVRHDDVATERGEIFDIRIDQMADEVWGSENPYYFLYKRSSDVIHGHWRVISKYHLAKSFNPMHNGLFWYNDNPNRFAGLIPAFISLQIATEFLIRVLQDIESEQINELHNRLVDLLQRLHKGYMMYFNKYIKQEVEENIDPSGLDEVS
ncbi:MAG: DUF5677 domain-containing protein [Bacteroidetes bacterium]|nr:DUF5677 domain-containing protein [Bacteroidota bacterium]